MIRSRIFSVVAVVFMISLFSAATVVADEEYGKYWWTAIDGTVVLQKPGNVSRYGVELEYIVKSNVEIDGEVQEKTDTLRLGPILDSTKFVIIENNTADTLHFGAYNTAAWALLNGRQVSLHVLMYYCGGECDYEIREVKAIVKFD